MELISIPTLSCNCCQIGKLLKATGAQQRALAPLPRARSHLGCFMGPHGTVQPRKRRGVREQAASGM